MPLASDHKNSSCKYHRSQISLNIHSTGIHALGFFFSIKFCMQRGQDEISMTILKFWLFNWVLVYVCAWMMVRKRRGSAEEPGQQVAKNRMDGLTNPSKARHIATNTYITDRSQRTNDWNDEPRYACSSSHQGPCRPQTCSKPLKTKVLWYPEAVGVANQDSTDVTYIMKRKNLLILCAKVTPVISN